MNDRGVAANLGMYVYGGAGILLGLVGLVSGDFAVPWQHVAANGTLRELLAYVAALAELAGGILLFAPRTARIGAVMLTIVYSAFTLLWVPKAFVDVFRLQYDAMGNVFEEFSMVLGGLVLCAILFPAASRTARREVLSARMFGLCCVSFGIVHVVDTMTGLTGWIPRWLPPTQLFWAYATTVGFFLAAAAILSGIMAPIAARLLTAEIVSFQLLVWIPKVVAGPREHFNWSGNGINLAIAASAWVVADSLGCAARRRVASVKASAKAGSTV